MEAQVAEPDLIAERVQHYFDGLYHSSRADLEASFHPGATIAGISSVTGKPDEISYGEFVAFVTAQPAPSRQGEPQDMQIVSSDVTGSVAMVKATNRYLGKRFTDYLLVIKDEGRWRIYGKLWHAEPVSA